MARDIDLRDKISCIEESLSFVPHDMLKSLITQENVEEVLKNTNPKAHELDTWSAAYRGKLASFVIKDANAIFAILLMMKRPRRIEEFFENRLKNEILPISVIGKERPPKVQSRNMHMTMAEDRLRNTFLSSVWEPSDIREFIIKQWIFLSPVLKQSEFEFEFKFDFEMTLPWTPCYSPVEPIRGVYAQVEKRAVPISHFNLTWGQHLIAVKKLTGGRQEKNAKKEADALKLLRTIQSEHVIKGIIYFKKQTMKDSSQTFWHLEFKGEKPELGKDFLVWAVGQLFGLMDAIRMMHDLGLRHGDLKPENILCFPDSSQPGAIPVRLVITDVGLSKAHEKSTSERKEQLREATTTTVSTTRYQPPELKMQRTEDHVLPRCFDVWSAGCIFMEFLVWMLYGKKELLTFTRKTESVEYWEKDDKCFKVRKVVCEQLHAMTQDENCTNDPALVGLADLIKNNFLIIDVWSLVHGRDKNIVSRVSLTRNKSSASTKLMKTSKKLTKRIARVLTNKQRNCSDTLQERYRDTSEQATENIRKIKTEILSRTNGVD
ncbi:unnamed protein product [Clonostachys solani]|uniref:Protein kinase domain-containing protein n=1 Tax=Clonostachys solani TaxID=160281 RepID=A0A9N9ZNI0_9HYPO|nr:unnamed protein product [Clonostachys solani]